MLNTSTRPGRCFVTYGEHKSRKPNAPVERTVWVHARGNRGTVTHVAVYNKTRNETIYETRHRRKISRDRPVHRMPKWLAAALRKAVK